MDITATAGGLSLSMPSALQSSTGEDILVKNVGSNTFTLKDYSGGTITTVIAGASIYVYLKDVSTAAGQWATVAFGVGSSSVNAASLIGFGIKAIGASLNQSHPATTANVNFTIAASDRAELYLDSIGITITLPPANGIGNDFFFMVRNISAGTTTLDASGADLIDGASFITLSPEESCIVCCTGTAWFTVGRGRSTTFVYTQLTKNVAGNTNVTLTGAEASNAILKFIGALTGNINVIVPNITAIWYVDNATSGAYTLTVKTVSGTGIPVATSNRVILYGDGVNVYDAQTVFTSSGAFGSGTASVPSITFASDPDTGLYNPSTNQVGITANGSQVALFTTGGLNVSGALTLGTDLAVLQGGTGASDAPTARTNLGISATNTPNTPSGNLAATDVQGALNELQTDVDTRAVASTVNAALALKVSKTSDTGSAVMPSGTTGQRDGSPVAGYLRYNSTLIQFEGYNGTTWGAVGGGGGATGGGTGPALNAMFFENDTLVTENYTIGQGALRSGVTVVAATNLFTLTAHNFIADQLVQFSTTTTLPAPLVAATGYYVIASGLTVDDFKISTTLGGTELDITTTGTGTHSVGKLKNASSTGTITIATSKTVIVPTNATWSIN
jgi:hypothetical protein